jgi:hypothetical protein
LPERPLSDYKPPNDGPLGALPLPTPLAIILSTMHRKYAAGDMEGAVALARIAAPYLHAHALSAIPMTDLATMPDADLDALKAQD